MPIRVKPADKVAAKWSTKAQGATNDYKDGINNPKNDWAQQTEAQAPVWQAAVANAAEAFKRGVSGAGTQKWQRKSLSVGAQRYAGGVQAAQQDYQAAISKVLTVIGSINLPPKSFRGDPANQQRSSLVGQTLHAAKMQGAFTKGA